MQSLICGVGRYKHINGKKYDNRKRNILPVRGFKNNGKTILNGYIAIYMPEHIRAFSNGCVYEHVLIAEKILGRPLSDEECVHHKNKNRQDNTDGNLMVFASNSDHTAYHNGGIAVLREDGVYYTEAIEKNVVIREVPINKNKHISKKQKKVKKIKKVLCPKCNKNYKAVKSAFCVECRKQEKSKHIPKREELELVIYNTPFTKIGEMYGVSDNAIRKWCKKYGLPYKKKDIKTFLK